MRNQSGSPRRPALAILVALAALGPMALNIFVPSLPGMQGVFDTDYGRVQLTVTLYFAAFAVAQLVYGPLSDRLGRRPVLLAGLGLFGVGNLLCLTASSIDALIAGRVVQAVGGCAGLVLSRAVIRDLYGREQSASILAYVTMAMVVVPMFAPAIGGYLDVWYGWRAGFALVLLFGAVVLAASAFALHETHFDRSSTRGVAGLAASSCRLLHNRAFLGYALQVGGTAGTFFTFVGGAPYVMVEVMGRPPNEYGLYFIVIAVGYMTGNFVSGRISVRAGVDRMVLWGTSLAVAGMAAMAALTATGTLTPATLFASMGVVSLGHGFSMPNGTAGAVSVDPRRAGAASGIAGFLQMALGALGTWIVGLWLGGTATPLVAVMSASTILAFAAYFLGVRLSRPVAP